VSLFGRRSRLRGLDYLTYCGVLLVLGWIGFKVVGLRRMEHARRERVERAVQLAVAAEAQWRDYFRSRKAWPDPRAPSGRSQRFPIVRDEPHHDWYVISHWLSKDGRTFMVIDSIHHDGDMSVSSAPGAGVAVWTTDGGKTWHCGPYGWGHVEDFPASCREPDAPRAYSPFGWVS
jgi:hypothetical protein